MTTLTAPHPPDLLCWDLGVQGKQTYLYPIHTLYIFIYSALHFSLYYNKLYHAIFIPTTNIKDQTFVTR